MSVKEKLGRISSVVSITTVLSRRANVQDVGTIFVCLFGSFNFPV